MALFTTKFNIIANQNQLEFVDIDIDDDNLLFLDARAIEFSTDSNYKEMRKKLRIFSRELITTLINPNSTRQNLKLLFGGFNELPYTRLGYGVSNFYGSGIGNNRLRDELINSLISNRAVATGALSHFGQMELVADNISVDRISDSTSKILAKELCEFTIQQCKKLNISNKHIDAFSIEYFDDKTCKWQIQKFLLPYSILNGNKIPIILVPKYLVRDKDDGNRTLNHFLTFLISTNLLPNGYFIKENPVPTGLKGKFKLKDYKLVIKDKGIKSEISKILASNINRTLIVDFYSNYWNVEDSLLSDEQLTNIVLNGKKKIA